MVVPRVWVTPWVNYMRVMLIVSYIHRIVLPKQFKAFKYIVLYLFNRPIVYLTNPILWINSVCNIDIQICDIKPVMLLFYITWFGNVGSPRIMALWWVIQKVLQEKYIFKLLLKLNYNGKETILGIKSY